LDTNGPLHVTPIHTKHPEVFAGISGPGHPIVGDGYGGYRTGREGTMYRGTAPAKPGWLELGDRARGTAVSNGIIPPLRPIWELHLRDTIINKGGDGFYYMTGSSGDNIWDVTSGIELWRSKDLRKWDYVGLVWSFVKDATWEKGARYVWAPEIHYIRGNYYFAYCVSGGEGGGTGILKSATGKPEGPYVYALASGARIGGGIDATLFEDDDGSVYFTSGGAGSIRKMLPDLSGFEGEPHNIAYEKPADEPGRATVSRRRARRFSNTTGFTILAARVSTRTATAAWQRCPPMFLALTNTGKRPCRAGVAEIISKARMASGIALVLATTTSRRGARNRAWCGLISRRTGASRSRTSSLPLSCAPARRRAGARP
jgi:hypothetical protein